MFKALFVCSGDYHACITKSVPVKGMSTRLKRIKEITHKGNVQQYEVTVEQVNT
jgi:glutamate/tyrosine decarboxylase-like PLP-dependent enzyme